MAVGQWPKMIRALAAKYGVDPAAALAVASVEGLSGAVGDNGTSYGPYQLHIGGALPKGRDRAWAESPQGLDFAMRQIAGVSKGLRGRAAIEAIVNRFERPANPAGEVARALAALGSVPTGAGTPGPTPVPVQGASTVPALQQTAGPLAGLDPLRQKLALGLLTQHSGLGSLNPELLNMALSHLTQPASPAAQPRMQPSPKEAPPQFQEHPHADSWVKLAAGADRHGVATNQAVIQFVERIAERYGKPVTIGTGTNHHQFARPGHQSDHWTGHAADIPATGKQLIALGQAALVAAGADPLWAAQQQGGIYTVHHHQIIFNVDLGPNGGGSHLDHLHVSAY